MQVVFFLELNTINLFPMLFFRLMGKEVFYLTASKFFQSKNRIQFLDKSGVKWLNYQNYPAGVVSEIWTKPQVLCKLVADSLSKKNSFDLLKEQLNLNQKLEQCLRVCIERRIYPRARMFSELLFFAEHIGNTGKEVIGFWIPNDIISFEISRVENNIRNFCPKWWTIFELVFTSIPILLKKFRNKIPAFRLGKSSKSEFDFNLEEEEKVKKVLLFSDFEVIFFPHHGIWYGNLFKKDHFYSKDLDNPFFLSRILHISLGESHSQIQKSIDFYNNHKIPYCDWNDFKTSPIELIKLSATFILKFIKLSWKDWDLSLLIHYINIVYITIGNLKKLTQLTQLKAILVGYDILFPAELALAGRIKNIKCIAVQERMLTTLGSSRMILDHYFVFGKEIKKRLEEIHDELLPHIYATGPTRLKDHYQATKKRLSLRATIPKGYKFVVLVLDFHSGKHWYTNGRSVVNNWKNNSWFYRQILKLCEVFTFAHFMIKGKNTDFLNIPYFRDIVDQIEKTPNCEVVQDYQTWTPFTSASVADITIALHTSLGDEILAMGKPVIFYDLFGFPSKVLDYGNKATAYSFEDLKEKLGRFFASPKEYNNDLNFLRNKFYTVTDKSIVKVLNAKLLDILYSQS